MCISFRDPHTEEDYSNYHAVRPALAIKMMFLATTLIVSTDLIADPVIHNHVRKIWIPLVFYLSSALVALLTYVITRRIYSRRRLTEFLIFLMIWLFFALTVIGRALLGAFDEERRIVGYFLADLVFLSVGLFAIRSLEMRMVHILGIFAVGMAGCIVNYRDEVNYFLGKAICALLYTGVLLIYSEKNRRNAYLRASGINSELRRIANLVPNGAVIFNSSKSVVFSNSWFEAMLLEGNRAISLENSPQGMYTLLNTKFKDLKPLTEPSVIKDPANPLIEPFPPILMPPIEINFQHPTVDDVISALLRQERGIRAPGPNSSQRVRVIYNATSSQRQYELHFMYTAHKAAGASVLLLIFDTTTTQENKALSLKNKSHTQTVAYIVHELRTPLSSSLIMLQNILDLHDVSVEVCERLIKPTISSLKLLMSLVNDILDMAQMNEDKLSFTFLPISIERVIEDTLNVIGVLANLKNIRIIQKGSYIPSTFRTDGNRFQQILMNLLSNAIKFTEPGGTITISADVIQTLPCVVEITVEDTGIGIGEEDQKQLFQEFTKINLGEKIHMNASGCGLGLNLANKLAMALGRGTQDHILVRSILGEGSAFTFFLVDKQSQNARESLEIDSSSRPKETLNNIDYSVALEENTKQKDSDQNSKIGFINASYMTGNRVHSGIIKFTSQHDYDVDQLQLDITERDSPTRSEQIDVSSVSEQKFMNEPPGFRVKNKQISRIQRQHKMLRRGQSDEFDLLGTPDSRDLSMTSPTADPIVLVVDDDGTCLYSLEICISALGVKAQYCRSGEEAYELIAKRLEQSEGGDQGYRLVFMDRNMPKMDGLETTRKIRELLLKKNIPSEYLTIIGTSALDSEQVNQELLEAGMNEVVSKPLTKEAVLNLFIKYKIKS